MFLGLYHVRLKISKSTKAASEKAMVQSEKIKCLFGGKIAGMNASFSPYLIKSTCC